jgi:hypothetical protein
MLFSTGITGWGVYDVNVRFRIYLFFTLGIFAFASVMYWRLQLFTASEYVEIPSRNLVKLHRDVTKNTLKEN